MTDEYTGGGGVGSGGDDLIEIDLNFESMRRFQAEFSQNLSKEGLFIDTMEPLDPGSVIRFRVILPEDFVFLEGTAVVEWRRGAESSSDGAPGMALRFVALSPQNQELVEQLVQDHVDAGGTAFDLDVRPVPDEFPTDALEGSAEPPERQPAEGYRLTVRRTGPEIQAEALQALSEASPDGGGEATDADPADDEPVEFEIVDVPPSAPAGGPQQPADEAVDAESGIDEIGDPPQLEWPEDEAITGGPPPAIPAPAPEHDVEPPIEPDADQPAAEPPDASVPPSVGRDIVDDVHDETAERPLDPALLDVPSDFDDGPEIIDDVPRDDFGGSTFDVSLPGTDDDGPDTTPVLPDEGGNDVTVSSDDSSGARSKPRMWPYAAAAVLVLVVAAALLRPTVSSWLESRGAEADAAVEAETAAEQVVAASEPAPADTEQVEAGAAEQPLSDSADQPSEGSAEPISDDAEATAPESATSAAGDEAPNAAAEAGAETDDPPAEPPGRLERADAIDSIEVAADPRGTVVTIRGNGSLESGVLSMESLPSPPRVLVRLRGIESVFRPYVIDAATAEVVQVRIGHHAERRPPELWLVLDLTSADVGIDGVDIRGSSAELVIAGP